MTDTTHWTASEQAVEGAVYRIRLCRPETMNAMTPTLYGEIRSGVLAALGNEQVRVIVIEGSGGVFAAGGDLKILRGILELPPSERLLAFNDAYDAPLPFETIIDCWKPVIAKIDGYALAGGTILAAAADIAIATDRSTFGIPEGRVGIADPFAATLLPAAVGLGRARYMLLTGAYVDAATAEQWGLVLRSVSPDQLDSAVDDVITQLLAVAPEAQRRYKRTSTRGLPRMSALEIMEVAISPNGCEGLAAFAEKRAPSWGRTTYPI